MKISKNSFRFCKITITILAWLAFIFRIKELMLISFLLLFFSAILKIKKAPLILLYSKTIDKITSSKKIDIDEKAMRFTHFLGSIFSGICTILIYLNIKVGWAFVFVYAIMKTISTFGYCPGEKVYSCMKNGCCRITKK